MEPAPQNTAHSEGSIIPLERPFTHESTSYITEKIQEQFPGYTVTISKDVEGDKYNKGEERVRWSLRNEGGREIYVTSLHGDEITDTDIEERKDEVVKSFKKFIVENSTQKKAA
jgi:hypothetical protein